MADRRELCVGGKPISSLRVVDLKVELEKRSLPKSGSKKDLLERLRLHLQLEEDREAALRDEEHVPNLSLCNETENDFIREYLAAQQARFQVQREAKKQYEEKKRESEASAEETTQDEDEASDVSPTKKSPRKAMRPKKKEDSTSTPKAQKSSLDFQTPDSMPYSTPLLDKRDDDAASHEDDTTGEEEEARTPQTRKQKILKYVQQPATSKGSNSGKSDSGQFSIADHVEKFQAGESSDRRDPPPSSLYGEAINLKVSGKKDTSPAKKESSPSKKESPPVKKDERPQRSLRGQSAKIAPTEATQKEEEVFPRLVEVWSEKEREKEAEDAKKVADAEKTPEVTLVEVTSPSSVDCSFAEIQPVDLKVNEAPSTVVSAEKPSQETVHPIEKETSETVKPSPTKPDVEKEPTVSATPEVVPSDSEEASKHVGDVAEKEQTAEDAKETVTPQVEEEKSVDEPKEIEKPPATAEAIEQQPTVESSPVLPSEKVEEATSPSTVEEEKVDLPVEERSQTPNKPDEPAAESQPEEMSAETKPDNSTRKSVVVSSPERPTAVMAVDNERPPLDQSDVPDKPITKVEQVSQPEPADENDEDELQMDTTEVIDDSLKLTVGDAEEMNENSENEMQTKSRSRSRSSQSSQSSSEHERSRNGRSASPKDQQKQQTQQAPVQSEAHTGRKLKIRKQQPSQEAESSEGGVPRKRRWGTSQLLPTKKPALVISTDSLKTLVPDAKPLSAEEVRLGSPNFHQPAKASVSSKQSGDHHSSDEKIEKIEVVRRVAVEVAAEALAPSKPEVVLAAAAPLLEATSPAQQPRSCVLSVSNLVRPFTINQLKELLARTGHLVDGKFWIDKVKSSCLVQYNTEEEAEETRAALHGIHWPTSNPKTLVVDYSTVEILDDRMSGKEINPPVAKVEPTMRLSTSTVQTVDSKRDKNDKVREWDVGKPGEQGYERDRAALDARPVDDHGVVKPKDETPAKLLDDLFRKTKATPCIYWLPLTASQIAEKEEMRRKRLVEKEARMKDVQQRRDGELQQRQREREKQRENERERQKARERERDKERERQRSRKRSRSSSRSSSSTTSSPNKRRNSKTPPRKR
uniref:EOG090X0F73 n=1 Tax=Scapholeberis mucronata TaxID=202097 RepID=A0A4Y7NMV0_9CRUS|nr:EOG090X0F73 [Scapholeberis mucronata]SVE93926.1 EOG090X0F73 [Scapholeberis mucronata]